MPEDRVLLSFTESNYHQAMTCLIANKISFSGTIQSDDSVSKIRQELTDLIPKINQAYYDSDVKEEDFLKVLERLKRLAEGNESFTPSCSNTKCEDFSKCKCNNPYYVCYKR